MPDDVTPVEEIWERVKKLRPVLSGGQNAGGYLNLFDEFVRECELDLALHCVCDYLLERATPKLDRTTAEEVCSIHLAMELQDDCTERLRAKTVGSTTGGQ